MASPLRDRENVDAGRSEHGSRKFRFHVRAPRRSFKSFGTSLGPQKDVLCSDSHKYYGL